MKKNLKFETIRYLSLKVEEKKSILRIPGSWSRNCPVNTPKVPKVLYILKSILRILSMCIMYKKLK